MSDEVLKLLDKKFEELNKDPLVKVIILTGGERCFSTGADINEMERCKTSEEAKAMAGQHNSHGFHQSAMAFIPVSSQNALSSS
jgi:enoyl-CoA hydratase/carnithine racemase